MEFLKAILFGIVEGITEWLPVSSTGHLILLNEFIKLDVSERFWSVFLVVIQLGAIMAVVYVYWERIMPFYRIYPTDEEFEEYGEYAKLRTGVDAEALYLWIKIIIACIPAVVVGLLADDWVDAHLYNWVVISIMLILVGFALIFVEAYTRGRRPFIGDMAEFTYKEVFIIGLFQVIAAILPGTSRSGITIIAGLLLGATRRASVDFTFCLAVPIMLGASVLKIAKNGLGHDIIEWIILLLGIGTAFIVSLYVIRFFLDFVLTHNLAPFGLYRIGLGILIILVFIIRGLVSHFSGGAEETAMLTNLFPYLTA